MTGDWITINEACDHFQVTRRTIERWREKYTIRAARLTRRHPIMLNIHDLAHADQQAVRRDPTRRHAA